MTTPITTVMQKITFYYPLEYANEQTQYGPKNLWGVGKRQFLVFSKGHFPHLPHEGVHNNLLCFLTNPHMKLKH